MHILKNTEKKKKVSQPYVSRYVSKLIKYDLIKEERKEGYKNFSLTEKAIIYITPSLKKFENLIKND